MRAPRWRQGFRVVAAISIAGLCLAIVPGNVNRSHAGPIVLGTDPDHDGARNDPSVPADDCPIAFDPEQEPGGVIFPIAAPECANPATYPGLLVVHKVDQYGDEVFWQSAWITPLGPQNGGIFPEDGNDTLGVLGSALGTWTQTGLPASYTGGDPSPAAPPGCSTGTFTVTDPGTDPPYLINVFDVVDVCPDTDVCVGGSVGDGLTTQAELGYGSDPAKCDSDGDGLPDGYEVNVTFTYPANPDTDGDGWSDGRELSLFTDPLNGFNFPPGTAPALPDPVAPGGGGPSPSPSPSPQPSPTPPPPLPVYVALGDSYSSGEGAHTFEIENAQPAGGTYFDGTDEAGVDVCHRSPQAYPYNIEKLASLTTKFYACSGAVVANFYVSAAGPGGWNEPSQLLGSLVAAAAMPGTVIKYVTLTVGGNDANFAPILTACVTARIKLSQSCSKNSSLWMTSAKLTALGAQLAQLYEDIHNVVPKAKVYVMGYPRLFAAKPNNDNCAIYAKDASYINDQELKLNSTIAAAVATANQTDGITSVYYVNSLDAFAGHELCWPANDPRHLPYLHSWIPVVGDPPAKVESFHPNVLGMAAWGTLINNAVT